MMNRTDVMEWPEGLPADYDELYRQYSGQVSKLLNHYNKVERNMADLHQYIWKKLIEVDILGKYAESVSTKMPRTMTALEACDFLGVIFGRWRTAMYAFHKGQPKYDANHVEIRRTGGHWMPTPINLENFQARGLLGYSAKTAVFSTEDIIKLSVMEKILKNGKTVGAFHKHGPLKMPKGESCKIKFDRYLANAVHNHFANWCRTVERRHKERAFDMFSEFRPNIDEPLAPENNLADPQATRQEAIAMLTNVKKKMHETLSATIRNSEKTPEQHAEDIFTLLQDGYTLTEAVRKLDFPRHVQTALMRVVEQLS